MRTRCDLESIFRPVWVYFPPKMDLSEQAPPQLPDDLMLGGGSDDGTHLHQFLRNFLFFSFSVFIFSEKRGLP